MQRYFVKNIDGRQVVMDDSDIHHIKKVMRMSAHEKIECVFNNKLYLCEINNIDPLEVNVIDEIVVDSKMQVAVTICIPLLVEQKMDFILQKCTELGVSEIFLFDAVRSKVKLDNDKLNKKIDRWMKICKEASEQSHRVDIPKISGIYKLKNLAEFNGLKLVCSTSFCESIKKVLKKESNCDKILIVVGPEGGLSINEEDELVAGGFKRISLGSNILRAETAPICAISSVNYEFME